MSVDLFVYSGHDRPVARTDVQAKMQAAGWDVAFVGDWFKPSPAPGDSVTDDEIVIGWRSDPDLSSQVQTMLAAGDRAALERLYDQMAIGTCGLSVSPQEIEEDEERVPGDCSPAHRYAFGNAKLRYYLRTSGGRSPLSYDLQFALWQGIGQATNGLLEDPQTGELLFSHEPAELPKTSTPEALRALKERAAPWWAVEWYGALSVAGLFLLLTHRSPAWISIFLMCHALFAYGFYRGWRWVWQIAVGLSGAVVAFGLIFLFAGGFRPYLIPPILFWGYLLFRLLSSETRDYF